MCYADQNHGVTNSESKQSLIRPRNVLSHPKPQRDLSNSSNSVEKLNVAKLSRWTEQMINPDVATEKV